MAGEDRDQSGNITVLPDQSQAGAIIVRGTSSDIQIYKDILCEKFALAKTAEEYKDLIELRQKIQELDASSRRLDYAEKSSEIQLQEVKQKAVFQRVQQAIASLSSVCIGIYFIQITPLPGLLFLILGLARPLGYSLGEISNLLDGLKGFPKDLHQPNSNEQDVQ
jgi:tetrahydromethanopterin S-methyltransferase subunit G